MPLQLLDSHAQAILALADGTVFQGLSIGAPGHTVGEVVFNTALTGYQEILTDPSYCGQIVVMTATQIGNVGVNPEDAESARLVGQHAGKLACAGFAIRELSPLEANWRSTGTWTCTKRCVLRRWCGPRRWSRRVTSRSSRRRRT